MKKQTIAVIALALGSAAFAADTDPVLMSIDGHDVRLSEFEYLYNKNNTQQLQPHTLDEYLQMFIDYKLKVAEAEHAGIDRTPDFRSEFDNFRAELSKPYMVDSTVINALVDEAYGFYTTDVRVSHIMLPPGHAAALDSIRSAILAGTTTFEAAAAANSMDRGSSQRGGYMGYVMPDRLPYPFVKAAYSTGEGHISPVVNSGFGEHIIRVEERKPAAGQVLVEHILLLTRGKSPAAADSIHGVIDSLYTVAAGGADFAELARRYSEDPGTRADGGRLPWFGRGAMIAEFDSVAFAMPVGTISQPFGTSFGYHIINKLDSKPVESYEDMRPRLLEAVAGDERAEQSREAVVTRELERYHAHLVEKGFNKARRVMERCGGYDSVAIERLKGMNNAVAEYDGGKVTIADAMTAVARTASTNIDDAINLLKGAAWGIVRTRVMNLYRDALAAEHPDYRNLLNEYRDGIMLFEISNREVWEKAARDTTGLNDYFRANISRYAWEQPRFKSYIIFAASDSLLAAALNYADTLGDISTTSPTAFTAAMRDHFGRDVRVERVIASRGENPITDYLAFGGSKPDAEQAGRWVAYAPYKGHLITVPEEPADVRGAAITDYQSELERRWVQSLRTKYRVKVNYEVFDALKAAQPNN